MTELETIREVNECGIANLKQVGASLDPSHPDSCSIFSKQVTSVHCAIVHTYAIVAHLSIREENPEAAAALWRQISELCDKALAVLVRLKDVYPHCNAGSLYDLALDYKLEADKRRRANEEDAECLKTPFPTGLFPSAS